MSLIESRRLSTPETSVPSPPELLDNDDSIELSLSESSEKPESNDSLVERFIDSIELRFLLTLLRAETELSAASNWSDSGVLSGVLSVVLSGVAT